MIGLLAMMLKVGQEEITPFPSQTYVLGGGA